MGGVVRLLPYNSVIGIAAVKIWLQFVALVFAVAAHMGVAAVLAGHERGS